MGEEKERRGGEDKILTDVQRKDKKGKEG